ncbi:MAG: hypothetical protein GX117_03110 [Candidatus Hydrogenedentes bacterium]|jgi:hypothetical protein|nr:hypothetical protein [Candidatus Hydrogenedentota bacterium]
MRSFIFILSACLLSMAAATASDVLVQEVRLSPPSIPFHRTAEYSVRVEAAPDVQILFPEMSDIPGQIEIKKTESDTETLQSGQVVHVQRYRVDPVAAGTYILPALNIGWQRLKEEGSIVTPILSFEARELTEAERGAAENFVAMVGPDAILAAQTPFKKSLWILLLSAAAAALLLLAIFRRYGRRKEAAAPLLPAWDIALNRLRELQLRDLPNLGKIELFYVDLSAILRYYIEDRFQIAAPDQTTPELMEAAAEHRIFSETQETFLAEFLRHCDRIKFARFNPPADLSNAHFKQVRLFVKETIPAHEQDQTRETAA